MEIIFEIKEKINKKGFYGRIRLEIVKTMENITKLDFDHDSKWFNAVNFGVGFFYENYLKIRKEGGFNICVKDLDTQIVDTNNMVVFYITVKALCRYFKLDENLVFINEEGDFIIAK